MPEAMQFFASLKFPHELVFISPTSILLGKEYALAIDQVQFFVTFSNDCRQLDALTAIAFRLDELSAHIMSAIVGREETIFLASCSRAGSLTPTLVQEVFKLFISFFIPAQ